MFKHANTLQPGDTVKTVDQTTGKTASAAGKVVEYDHDTELFKVAHGAAGASWHSLGELVKVSGS